MRGPSKPIILVSAVKKVTERASDQSNSPGDATNARKQALDAPARAPALSTRRIPSMKANVQSVSCPPCDPPVRGRSLDPIRSLCRVLSFRRALHVALCCVTLCAPSLALAQQATIAITSAQMSDSHTLQVGVSAQFLPSQG